MTSGAKWLAMGRCMGVCLAELEEAGLIDRVESSNDRE